MDWTKTLALLGGIATAVWGTHRYWAPFLSRLIAKGILAPKWKVFVTIMEALEEVKAGTSPAGQFPSTGAEVVATAAAVAEAHGVDNAAVRIVGNFAKDLPGVDVSTKAGKVEIAEKLLAQYGPSLLAKLKK